MQRHFVFGIVVVGLVTLLGVLTLAPMSPVALAQSGGNTSTPTPAVTATPTPPTPVRGLPIPPQAVVGRVVSATLLYWRPSADAVVPLVLPAGKTAWVLGVDASGQFYKIVWADRYLWVPVEAMGPNDDEVWRGALLPTEVVE